VFSLMIGPPAAARFLSNRPATAMALSAVLALVTVWVSITASFWSNWPLGFFVGGFAVVWYSVGRLLAAGRKTSRPSSSGFGTPARSSHPGATSTANGPHAASAGASVSVA
ncbi:MAG TPA: hypothetical protein VEJ84_02275, partial [Acidimicrobiales bacterium]|nr:hypothetical protein [Acidimicrobiales bacterium]